MVRIIPWQPIMVNRMSALVSPARGWLPSPGWLGSWLCRQYEFSVLGEPQPVLPPPVLDHELPPSAEEVGARDPARLFASQCLGDFEEFRRIRSLGGLRITHERTIIILIPIVKRRWSVSKERAMYVCVCKGVTDREIRGCAALGATSLDELRECLGITTGCGKCELTARAVLETCGAPQPPEFEAA